MIFILDNEFEIVHLRVLICISAANMYDKQCRQDDNASSKSRLSVVWYDLIASLWIILTQRARGTMAAISQTFSDAFSWKKMFQFRLEFHWNLF